MCQRNSTALSESVSKNSLNVIENYFPKNKVKLSHFAEDSINRMDVSSKRHKVHINLFSKGYRELSVSIFTEFIIQIGN